MYEEEPSVEHWHRIRRRVRNYGAVKFVRGSPLVSLDAAGATQAYRCLFVNFPKLWSHEVGEMMDVNVILSSINAEYCYKELDFLAVELSQRSSMRFFRPPMREGFREDVYVDRCAGGSKGIEKRSC